MLDERADATAGRIRSEDEDTVIALTARDAVIVEIAEQRQHVLTARAGEIARARDCDRLRRYKLVDDRVREARHGVGEEDRFGADADDVAALAERRDHFTIEPVLALELLGRGRVRGIAGDDCPRALPCVLLLGRELRSMIG